MNREMSAPMENVPVASRESADASRQKNRRESVPVIYYSDEKNDEFSGVTRNRFEIDGNYRYLHKNPLWKFAAFVFYRIIMTPIAFFWCKIKFHAKIVNRKAIRKIGKQGCFVYGNHTLMAGDAFFPSLVAFPKTTDVVVGSDNLAVPATRPFIEMAGAIPVPTQMSATRGFLNCLEKKILLEHSVQIYPEAHIWPYYTGIRPFDSASFRYPIRFDAPVFCTTTTFQKRRGRTPRVTVFVDGPFYPDKTKSVRQQEKELRNAVYETMCRRARENNTAEPIRYIRREKQQPLAGAED